MWRLVLSFSLIIGFSFVMKNSTVQAQNNTGVDITYLGHATVLIEMDGIKLMTDPLLRNRIWHLWRHSEQIDPQVVGGVDVVLISHAHWDHLDIPSLKMFDDNTLFIVPPGVDDILYKAGNKNVQVLDVGEEISLGAVTIKATFAKHDGDRFKYFGDEEAVGYLIDGSRTIYFAGDTDIFPEMADMAGGVDVALLPVWGWGPWLGNGHLDPKGAAVAAQMIQPKVAVPIHWGTFFPIGLHWFMPSTLSQPPIWFKNEVERIAPAVEVVILPAGDTLYLSADSK